MCLLLLVSSGCRWSQILHDYLHLSCICNRIRCFRYQGKLLNVCTEFMMSLAKWLLLGDKADDVHAVASQLATQN